MDERARGGEFGDSCVECCGGGEDAPPYQCSNARVSPEHPVEILKALVSDFRHSRCHDSHGNSAENGENWGEGGYPDASSGLRREIDRLGEEEGNSTGEVSQDQIQWKVQVRAQPVVRDAGIRSDPRSKREMLRVSSGPNDGTEREREGGRGSVVTSWRAQRPVRSGTRWRPRRRPG